MMTIYAKLLAARKAMSFEKEKKTGLSYKILDGDTVLEMVGNALAAQSILFVPSMVHAEMAWYEKNNKPVQHALATVEVRFIDTETGDVLTATTHGSAEDFGDKALGKAQTYAIKYFFTRMFLKGKSDINDEENMNTPTVSTPARQESDNNRTITAPETAQAGETTLKTGDNGSAVSELDGIFWTRAVDTMDKLITWATGFWTMEGEEAPVENHVLNRICKALGLTSPKGKRAAFLKIMADECEVPKTDAIKILEAYEPQTAKV